MREKNWKSGSMRGDAIRNVPMSLRNDGHKIMIEEPLDHAAKHFGF